MPVTDGLGFTVYVEALLARLRRQLTEQKVLEPTLVVGVFGPWGCGKSTLLQMVHDRIQADAEQFAPQSLTLPVWFNPWRFETEEHLIIPLLKTTQQTLLSWQAARATRASGQPAGPAAQGPFDRLLRKALRQPPPPTPVHWLQRKAALLGQSAVALTYGLKGELHLPFVGKVAFSPKDAIEEERRRWQVLEQGPKNPLDDLQSLYYDLQRYLCELTGRDDSAQGEQLNLVFLIDDLDRCLPEKSVQVLEAIKLFLEVEGCAFLLAIDDEVIERGIAHRYRAYNPGTLRAYDSIAHALHPDRYRSFTERRAVDESSPISGAEYLEKIVHLPFRIPAPTPLQVRRFLATNFPALFAQRAPAASAEGKRGVPDATARALVAGAAQEPAPAAGDETRLLDLFEAAVPPVPRKLVRAAELLAFLQSVARERGVAYDPLTLARLVLLQLFAPEIYRFGRRNPRFFEAMERWLKEKTPARWRSDRLLDELEEDRRALLRAAEPAETKQPRAALPEAGHTPGEGVRPEEAYFIEKTELPLLRLLRSSLTNRSGFDPRSLLDLASPCDARLGRYFSLIEEAAAPPPAAAGELPSELPGGEVQDVEGFLNDLFADRKEAWLNAVNREELQGRTLGERTFGLLAERLALRRGREPEWPPAAWLEALAERLSRKQLRTLVAASRVLGRLQTEASAGSTEASRELGRLLSVVCRHHNPPHQPFAVPVRPAELGVETLDLAGADLRSAYLRGLEVPAQLPSAPDTLDGANLEDADLGAVPAASLGRLQLTGSRLLGAKGLPPRLRAASALVQIGEGAVVARPSPRTLSRCLGVLPDGRVVSGGDDGLRVWDLGSGRVVAELKGHGGRPVGSIAVLPDGRVVSGGGDGVLRVWDVGSGRVVAELKGHKGGVLSIAVLPDGRVVSGGGDAVLRVWEVGGGHVVAELKGHEAPVRSLVVLPDGRVVSGGDDRVLRVWDAGNGRGVAELKGHEASVRSLVVLPDGRVVSGGVDTVLRVWDVGSGRVVAELRGHEGGVLSIAVLPDGRVVSGGDDRDLRVWDVGSGRVVAEVKGHGWVWSVAVLPDGRVVSGGDDGLLRVWDGGSGSVVAELKGEEAWVRSLAVLPDSQVVSGGNDGLLRVWDVGSGRLLAELKGHEGSVRSLAVLPDGRVVSGGNDGVLRIWDVGSGRVVAELMGHEGPVDSVAVLPDGRAVSGGGDRVLRVWDVGSARVVAELKGHDDTVLTVAVLPDGRLVSSGREWVLRVWDVGSGRGVAKLKGLESPAWSLAALPDDHVVSGGGDGVLRVWDVGSGRAVAELKGHEGSVRSLAALPNGRVVSGGDDGLLRVWDIDRGRLVEELSGSEPVSSLAVVGGSRLLSGGALGLRVWDVAERRPLRWLFTPASDTVVTADERGFHVENRRREWRTLQGLPADPELDRYVGFVTADRRFGFSAHRLPNLLEWDDPKTPHRLTIRWPSDADRERFLGTVTVPKTDAPSERPITSGL
jgi:WD40 repeat protein